MQIKSRNQLKLDPLKELDEALMDRTTAQLTLKGQTSSTVNSSHKQRVYSSNFDKSTLPAVYAIKKMNLRASDSLQVINKNLNEKVSDLVFTRKRNVKAQEKQARSIKDVTSDH